MDQKEAVVGSMHSIEVVVIVACGESIRFGYVAAHVQKVVLFQTCASAGQTHQADQLWGLERREFAGTGF
jgi:hypothetical protein